MIGPGCSRRQLARLPRRVYGSPPCGQGGSPAGWPWRWPGSWAAGALLPLDPMFLSFSIDRSFGETLHYAALRGPHATHLVSTFGPLGLLYYDMYLPGTFGWLLAAKGVLAIITGWSLGWVAWSVWRSPWAVALLIAVSVPFLASPDVWCLTLPWLAPWLELPERRAPAALRALLGVAIGAVALIKFTFLLAALLVIGGMVVASMLGRRRLPLAALAAVAAVVLIWPLVGLGGSDWLAYLLVSVRQITPGYSAAMQIPASVALTLHAAAVSVTIVVGAAVTARRRLASGWWPALLALAGIVFLLFKAGFVRADVHIFITVFGLLVVAIMLAVLAGPEPRRLLLAALLVVVLPGGLVWHAVLVQGAPSFIFRPILPLEALRRVANAATTVASETLEAGYARSQAELRRAEPLPPLEGTVDVYPVQQSLMFAYGYDFRPRPVFQSYMAYTPALGRINADALGAPGAPEWILFLPISIDGRFPALDDAASWPELMSRYAPVGRAGSFALLRRRSQPLPWTLEPLDSLQASTDTAIPVPPSSDGPIWARIDVQETAGDALAATLLAAPLVSLDITLADGRQWRYRLVPRVARAGFVLSPLVGTADNFLRLMRLDPVLLHAPIASVRVHVDGVLGTTAATRTVDVQFFRLRIGAPSGA